MFDPRHHVADGLSQHHPLPPLGHYYTMDVADG
jgi:hypothetical protein